jgi:rSAM/selenodomain-associated transferase 2
VTPRVSIIIPARNDAVALRRTLDWLRDVEGIREAEVIVAASGDPTGTLRALQGRMQILWPSGSTRSALMNAGADVARAPILFFVHADSFPPRHALGLIEQVLREEHVVGGAFEHRFEESHRSLRVISWINRMRYRLTRNYYGDQGLFVRASTFHALGGYRDLPLLEDLDFSRRLKRAGRTAFVRAPLVTSGRRFLARGPWRTFFFIVWLLLLYSLRLGTARYAERWRGPAELSPGSLWPLDRLRTGDRRDTSWGVSETPRGGVFRPRVGELPAPAPARGAGARGSPAGAGR